MNDESQTEQPEGSVPNEDTERPAAEPRGGDRTGAGSTNASSTTALQEDPETIRQERDDYRDRLLRSTAEFDNYRKRVERERRELSDYAASELLKDVLPLVDDLERALAAPPGTDTAATLASYRAGVELIYRQVLELLRKRGVTAVDALGADFDPHVHQAVTQEPSPAHRDGEVIEELRRGYKLGDRLLRPAMVKVASRE
jgi:molecular chaperone GrpE